MKALVAGVVVAALLVTGCSDGAAKPKAAGTPAATSTASAAAGPAEVSISDFVFSPTPVRVPVGATVTWTNLDSAVHSVKSGTETSLASESLEQNGTYSYTATAAGTIDYICGIHNYMTGQIVITES